MTHVAQVVAGVSATQVKDQAQSHEAVPYDGPSFADVKAEQEAQQAAGPRDANDIKADIGALIADIDEALNADETEGMTAFEAYQYYVKKARNPLAILQEQLGEFQGLMDRAKLLKNEASQSGMPVKEVAGLGEAMGKLHERIAELEAKIDAMRNELEHPGGEGVAGAAPASASIMAIRVETSPAAQLFELSQPG